MAWMSLKFFSKVSSAVIVHSKLSSELTFENFCQMLAKWGADVVGVNCGGE